jgi:asparagine synthase (glutamine-hydrolysing)
LSGRCEELARMLDASVSRNRCDALLLSGGLDSSILASILRPEYAVACSFGSQSPDLEYAKEVAGMFCCEFVHEVTSPEAMTELAERIVQAFQTFDPIEIRNSVVALAGIERAKKDGYTLVMTGDGGDELFAGYNYLSRYYSDLPRLDSEVRRLWQVMHFSSEKLGTHAGVKIRAPYLDAEFMEYAKSIPVREKVGERNGQKFGKYNLRVCYEKALGPKIAWRSKLAQEQGAGTERFHEFVEERIDDLSFSNRAKAALQEGVAIRSKEHLYYYAIFRSHFGPPKEESCEFRCTGCQGCLSEDGRFCRTCGAFPVTPVKSL